MLGFVVIWIMLAIFLPNEKEREAAKLKEIGNRNVLEKQLVGKWISSDVPARIKNDKYYHLLSADAGYTYRGSDNSKIYSGHWSIRISDSVLFINRNSQNNETYKIKEIETKHVRLQKLENDSLTIMIDWIHHPL